MPGYEINHIDGNPRNNRSDNLEYVTHRRNIQHAVETGLLQVNGESSRFAKSSEQQILHVKKLLSDGLEAKAIYERTGVSIDSIYKVKQRKTWKHLLVP